MSIVKIQPLFLYIWLNIINISLDSHLYALGKSCWKKWKKRYFCLVQVSQYTFAMCSYREKKSEPTEMMQLDGYTVDYIEAVSGKVTFCKGHTYSFQKFFIYRYSRYIKINLNFWTLKSKLLCLLIIIDIGWHEIKFMLQMLKTESYGHNLGCNLNW